MSQHDQLHGICQHFKFGILLQLGVRLVPCSIDWGPWFFTNRRDHFVPTPLDFFEIGVMDTFMEQSLPFCRTCATYPLANWHSNGTYPNVQYAQQRRCDHFPANYLYLLKHIKPLARFTPLLIIIFISIYYIYLKMIHHKYVSTTSSLYVSRDLQIVGEVVEPPNFEIWLSI